MAQEIELKLAFPAESRSIVLNAVTKIGAERAGRAQMLINTYYDTPELALSQARVALRTRKTGRRWLQTVKCAAESQGGLSSRPEWEQPYHDHFDFSAIDAPATRALLETHADRIIPLFTTNFRRETFILRPRVGVSIHLMVDSGSVDANGRSEPISELELELDEGRPQDLFAAACMLATDLPLLPFDPSKAERGYRLFGRNTTDPKNSLVVEANTQAPLEAFRDLARQSVTAWASNQYAAPLAKNPEYIHQLRLTLRRLRNLIRLFAPVLPQDFVDAWPTRLAALAEELSRTRDLDVLRDEVLPGLASHAPRTKQPFPVLLRQVRQEAQTARAAAMAELTRPGCGLALLTFSQALHNLTEVTPQPPLSYLGREALQSVCRLARRRFKKAASKRGVADFHALRIAIKRLRHATEIFGPLTLSNKDHLRNTTLLRQLQRELGQLHDLAVAQTCLADWTAKKPTLRKDVAFMNDLMTATSLQLESSILPGCIKLLEKKHWQANRKRASIQTGKNAAKRPRNKETD
jgi:inorganic triphosphatase YgiF